MNLQRVHILLQSIRVRCAGDGEDIIALEQEPGENQLRRRDAFLACELFELIDELEVLGEVLFAESWAELSEVALRDVGVGFERSGEEASANGRVCNDFYIALGVRSRGEVREGRRRLTGYTELATRVK